MKIGLNSEATISPVKVIPGKTEKELSPTYEQKLSAPQSITVAIAVAFTLCAVIFPEAAIGETARAADFFLRSALPAMLPFMVASGLLIKSGVGELCRKTVGRIFPRLFGINGALAAPFLLGAIAGFPIGAKAIAELYEGKECKKEEAERGLSLCSNPGFGFTVAGVGGAMWRDISFGLTAWLSCLLASVIIGIATKEKSAELTPAPQSEKRQSPEGFSVSKAVCASVKEAASTLINVFVFIAFFRALSATVLKALVLTTPIEPASPIGAAVIAFFEFSSGIAAIADSGAVGVPNSSTFISHALIAKLLTVSALAWSGLSVHLQIAGITAPYGIKMKKYYLRKLACAAIAPICFFIIHLLISR